MPPMPLIPFSVNPLSADPKLTCIVGVLPLAAVIVTALFVPVHVP
jgi:hypothetical protein